MGGTSVDKPVQRRLKFWAFAYVTGRNKEEKQSGNKENLSPKHRKYFSRFHMFKNLKRIRKANEYVKSRSQQLTLRRNYGRHLSFYAMQKYWNLCLSCIKMKKVVNYYRKYKILLTRSYSARSQAGRVDSQTMELRG